jgi:hypothetical protein
LLLLFEKEKAAASGGLVGCNAPVGWRVLGRCALLSGSSLYALRCVCLLLQDLLQSCSRGGEEESGRHVL